MAESFSVAMLQPPVSTTLCERCREYLDVTGVAISLMDGTDMSSICVADDRAARLDELQFTLGAGPSYDAFHFGQPVFDDEVNAPTSTRWPTLAEFALESGINGIFAFPLQIGAARTGVLTAYQADVKSWTLTQHADALTAADALTHVILSIQAKSRAGDLAGALWQTGTNRVEVHQASGMLSVQAGVSVAEALVLLRSHAYATTRPLASLASDVIIHRVRIERSGSTDLSWRED